MKSLWKRVIQSTLVVGIAASLTGSLIAQDPDPVGIGEAKVCLVTTMVTGRVIVPRITITPGSARRCVITSNANLGISSPQEETALESHGRGTIHASIQ